MKDVLIIETRDAAEHRGPERTVELATGLQAAAVPASIFLAENAVFAARRGLDLLDPAIQGGVAIAVDEFALSERGISATELRDGVSVAGVGLVIDRLVAGSCVMCR